MTILFRFLLLCFKTISSAFQLDTEPKHLFESQFCRDDFVLSSSNLEVVEVFLKNLREQHAAAVKISNDLRNKIGVLFENLELSGAEEFMLSHQGCTKMVLEEVNLFSESFIRRRKT